MKTRYSQVGGQRVRLYSLDGRTWSTDRQWLEVARERENKLTAGEYVGPRFGDKSKRQPPQQVVDISS